MEFFRIHKTIPFMHYRHVLNLISLVSFIVAVFWIFTHGLAFSIEFTGGTQMEVRYPSAANTEQVRQDLKAVSNEVLVQTFGTASDIVIRVPTKQGYTSGQVAEEVMKVIHQKTPEAQLTRTEYVGPQVGEELARDGGTALALVVAGIMIYLAFRFEWKFSVAAIIANLHDIFIVLGIFSVMQWEFSLPVLAAVLAVLGYSVNESVIIFDRVREHFRTMRRADTMEVTRRHDGGHQLGHYGDDLSYRDHAYVDALHDALDVLLRRSGAALLLARPDDRHSARRLLLRLRGGGHCALSWREARGPRASGQEGRG